MFCLSRGPPLGEIRGTSAAFARELPLPHMPTLMSRINKISLRTGACVHAGSAVRRLGEQQHALFERFGQRLRSQPNSGLPQSRPGVVRFFFVLGPFSGCPRVPELKRLRLQPASYR